MDHILTRLEAAHGGTAEMLALTDAAERHLHAGEAQVAVMEEALTEAREALDEMREACGTIRARAAELAGDGCDHGATLLRSVRRCH